MPDPTPQPVRPGPSRDMLGGPWLAVVVFIVVAIGMGWGLITLLQQQITGDRQRSETGQFEHDFDPDIDYELKRDMIIGYLADGRVVLLPGRNDLPSGTPGKRSAASVEELRSNPEDFPDLAGIVDAGTKLQFVEFIDDQANPQTRILVLTRLITGPYARKTPVLGMHLESVDTDEQTGEKRYVPRADLFGIVEAENGPVQSDTKSPAVE
ncbi:MAG: hypothetical protein AB8C95_03645 [Phycisphaeraceae bacterium]